MVLELAPTLASPRCNSTVERVLSVKRVGASFLLETVGYSRIDRPSATRGAHSLEGGLGRWVYILALFMDAVGEGGGGRGTILRREILFATVITYRNLVSIGQSCRTIPCPSGPSAMFSVYDIHSNRAISST